MMFYNTVSHNTINVGNYTCHYDGVLIYNGLPCGELSLQAFVNDFEQQIHSFDSFLGSFRLLMEDNRCSKIIFFGDNSGGMCFYYHVAKKTVSDSFLRLCEATSPIVADYDAIAQFMQFGCIYSEDTMCMGIKRTDTDCYYIVNNNELLVANKNLTPLRDLKTYDSLNSVIGTIVKSISDFEIADIVTGGVDSRMVLSNLISLGCRPELCIAEEPEHIDVRIASQIAKRLELSLNVFNTKENENWLENAFIASDGMNAVIARYSLLMMRRQMRESGFSVLFGGLCGELYKNSFINQDFPLLNGGRVNVERFYRMKVSASNYPLELCGNSIVSPVMNTSERIKSLLHGFNSGNKIKTYFDMGHWVMKCRVVAQSNLPNSMTMPIISPLLERDSLALAYGVNPYKLELQRFARREVSTHCKTIASIPTDRGLSCMDGEGQIFKETLANYLFLLKVALRRMLLRKKVPALSNTINYISEARNSLQYKTAILKCKELGVVNNECVAEKIPDSIADRVITVGTLFGRLS